MGCFIAFCHDTRTTRRYSCCATLSLPSALPSYTAQRADPSAPVDPRPGWSDLGPAVSHYGDRGYVAQNTDKTGNNARNEELSNIGFGQDAVDNQDDAGRDENPEGSAGRDGPGRQAVRIMVAPH